VLSARYDFLSIRPRSFSTSYGGQKADDIQRHRISFIFRNYRVTICTLPSNILVVMVSVNCLQTTIRFFTYHRKLFLLNFMLYAAYRPTYLKGRSQWSRSLRSVVFACSDTGTVILNPI